MKEAFTARGRHFEEFELGYKVISAGRTITEADIVNFAGLSGDYTQLHTNAEFARQGAFGRRVAHGLLVLSITSGQLVQLGFIRGTVLAFREMRWKFSRPVFIGDTVHTTAAVTKLRPMSKLGGGAVTFDVRVLNQENKVVQRGDWVLLMASKPQ